MNLEDITDEDYMHAQKVWDVFETENLGEYHDLYVQSDTLLLADAFEKFRETSRNISIRSCTFSISARTSMAGMFKKG